MSFRAAFPTAIIVAAILAAESAGHAQVTPPAVADTVRVFVPRAPFDSIVNPLHRLERARHHLMDDPFSYSESTDRREVYIRGADDFWIACETADSTVTHELWLDLRTLFTPAERAAWDSATTPGDRCKVVRDALEERAMRSAMTVDERLQLHYRRLANARARYWVNRARIMKTGASYRGKPDSLEVDDRGYMLIRLGPPDDVQFVTRELLGIEESWVYERPDGVWLFHFVPCDLNRRVPCMPRSGHALVESFGPLAVPGTFFFQTYVTRLALDPLPLRRLAFTYRSSDALDAKLDAAERGMQLRQVQMLARELQTRAITGVPDVPELMPAVDVVFEPLRFWNPTIGEATVWFVATARAEHLEPLPAADGGELRTPVLTVATRGPDGVVVRDVERRVVTAGAPSEDAGVDVFLRAALPPGPWPFTVALTDGNVPQPVGNWLQDTLSVPDFGSTYGSLLPALSDIAVAPDSGGAWTRDGKVFLPVTAAHVTGPDGAVHVYFEVYGIRPGASYDVELRLVAEDDADRIWKLDQDDLAFRLSFSSEMSGDGTGIGRHHLRLDFSDSRNGSYLLGVQVKKTQTGESSLPVTTPIAVLGRS